MFHSNTEANTEAMESVQEQNAPVAASLHDMAAKLTEFLNTRQPRWVEGVRQDLHPLPPSIPKDVWDALGDALKFAERPTMTNVPGEKFYSLRCDGTGFSKLMRIFRREGVFAQGYSDEFADIMKQTCTLLMERFSGICGYTQSDEMTVIVAPASVVRGEQQPHIYSGRIAKLTSLAAATATAHFNFCVQKLCQKHEIEYTPNLLATFDCRVGVYETKEEAVSLVLWRAHDCGINGVSDAVFHSKGAVPGAGKIVGMNTSEKLKWLDAQSLLPLCPHQREGSFFVKRKVRIEAVNSRTGEAVQCLRARIEHVPGNVLQLCKDGALFLLDDDNSQ